MHPYRVFVSYSHDDKELADVVVCRLRELGAVPLYDQHLKPGDRFSDEIRRYIAHAHVFMPILTPGAAARPWVHQEIGYAMGLSIPVFPLAVGELPDGLSGLIHALHALQVKSDLTGLEQGLTAPSITHAATSTMTPGDSIHHCAQSLGDRTHLLVEYATAIKKLGFYGMVRQRTAFGSFSLPSSRPSAHVWNVREDGHPRTQAERELLRGERMLLEEHARESGCRLILDPESVKSHGPESTAVRLQILRSFLNDMPDDRLEVVFARGEIQTGLIMVGDWFVADAVVPLYGQSYQKTVFTRHGPSVIQAVEAFDRDFEELKGEAGTASRDAAIAHIDLLLKQE